MSQLESLGARATLLDVFKKNKPMARHILGLAQAARDMSDEVTEAEFELIGVYVSGLNKNAYCHGLHSEVAVKCGMERRALPELVGSVPRYGDDRWRAVFAYVGALTTSPANVSPGHFEALREGGWSEQAVTQLAAIATVFALLNRLTDGLGLQGGPKFFKETGEQIANKGYAGLAKSLRLGAG